MMPKDCTKNTRTRITTLEQDIRSIKGDIQKTRETLIRLEERVCLLYKEVQIFWIPLILALIGGLLSILR